MAGARTTTILIWLRRQTKPFNCAPGPSNLRFVGRFLFLNPKLWILAFLIGLAELIQGLSVPPGSQQPARQCRPHRHSPHSDPTVGLTWRLFVFLVIR